MRSTLVCGIFLCATVGISLSPAFAQESADVDLKEWALGFKKMSVKNGHIRFDIENVGTVEHAFEVEGEAGGQKIEFKSPILKPGDKTTLEVDLPPYCPVHDHKDKGMRGKVTVGSM
jgi:uncharacterized cupredoxin-like copper-binding protein